MKIVHNKKDLVTLAAVLLLIALGFAMRMLPHPANFTPIAAIALFGGLYLNKRWAIIIPLLAMFVSDIFIGFYDPKVMLSVYGCFAAVGFIGLWVKKRKKVSTVIGGTLVGSVLFFLITNAAVWAFSPLYAHTAAGFMESYTMALPFFRNSLIGDLFYVGILVGSVEFMFAYRSRGLVRKEESVKA